MRRLQVFMAALVIVILASACAKLQEPVAVEDRSVVQMTASDFKFEPNNITARAGQTITFRIQNVSGTSHNFTLKDPGGAMVENVDIAPKQTVEVKAVFSKAGTYTFHCNKAGHSELGMKGQVVVTGG